MGQSREWPIAEPVIVDRAQLINQEIELFSQFSTGWQANPQRFQHMPVEDSLEVPGLKGLSLRQFAGAFDQIGHRGERQAANTSSDSNLIDWTDDEPSSLSPVSALGGTKQKNPWPQRFLLHLGMSEKEADPHHGIEVTLPKKK